MDSINKNQPEHNRENLGADEAVAKMKEIIKQAPTCFFCTYVAMGDTGGARPMNVRKVDDAGNLWFLSPKDSHTSAELAKDARVRLYFQASSHSDFMEIGGKASISTDKAKIHELWEPIIKTWFTEGEDDPRITVIKVEPTGGYYWDTKHGKTVAGIKMMVGAMLGKTLDDSIEGKLKP